MNMANFSLLKSFTAQNLYDCKRCIRVLTLESLKPVPNPQLSAYDFHVTDSNAAYLTYKCTE